MLLKFADNTAFAEGAVGYNNIAGYELSPQIILMVRLGDDPHTKMTEAVVNTGVPYLICTPSTAKTIGVDLAQPEESARVRIDGKMVEGGVHIVTLSLLATQGISLNLAVWAFVPHREEDFNPESLPPTFLGMGGCLGAFLFAVDPFSQTFYFG